jgi:hypothetical protein
MTPHQTLAVAVRLFAILLALFAARELLGIYVAGRDWNDPYLLSIVVVAFILVSALLIALWFFPKSIARGLLPLASDTPAKPSAGHMACRRLSPNWALACGIRCACSSA